MRNLCDYLKNNLFNKYEIEELTNVLAKSGKNLSFICNTADVPSTGGPSSLSTIICPLILKAYFSVPKLGIVGRPAGGIDVLAQIEGYKTKLDEASIYKIIEKTNYCHFISNNKYAPLDSLLFEYRSVNNFKDIPSLVIASLLAKKVAVGVKNVCLDIRYSYYGNFGKTLQESESLSLNFKEVADLLGIKSSFYFSDNNVLLQPYIGRGESLLAIAEIINGSSNTWLNNHLKKCVDIVKTLLPSEVIIRDLKDEICRNFIENIETQGGNFDSFINIAKRTDESHINKFVCPMNGTLRINLERMRNLIVSIQKKYVTKQREFPDPCGMIFYKNQNDSVKTNDVILTYRVRPDDLQYFQTELNKIVTIVD
jgi:pyrimidine-nucleoside phosphorylase